MANANKAKGTRWESAIVNHLVALGLGALRKVQRGRADQGDIEIREMPDLVIQAKDHGHMRLPEWIDAVAEQGLAAGAPIGVVVAKRRNKNVGEAFVVLDLDTFAGIINEVIEGRAAIDGQGDRT